MLTVDLRHPELEPKTVEIDGIEDVEPLLERHHRYSTAFVIENLRVVHIYKRRERAWIKDPPSQP